MSALLVKKIHEPSHFFSNPDKPSLPVPKKGETMVGFRCPTSQGVSPEIIFYAKNNEYLAAEQFSAKE